MKKLFITAIAIIILAVASCTPPAPAVDTVGEQNKVLVQKYFDAITTGDLTATAAMLADDYKAYGPARSDSSDRQKTLDNWKKSWDEQFSAVKYDEAVALAITVKPETNKGAAGDWVLKWGSVSVDYKNGSPSVKFNLHVATRVTNGKIDRVYDYYNVADILTQQGYTFVPPVKEEAKK